MKNNPLKHLTLLLLLITSGCSAIVTNANSPLSPANFDSHYNEKQMVNGSELLPKDYSSENKKTKCDNSEKDSCWKESK